MNYKSSNLSCPHCQQNSIIKDGFFNRQDDHKRVQRYRCKECKKRFCRSTFGYEYRQQKRTINYQLMMLLCSKVSIRRAALLLHIDKNTVLSRIRSMAVKYRDKHQEFLQRYIDVPVKYMQIDDLITKEKSKLKPLSVSIAIDADSKCILDMRVSKIAAFGTLVETALEKYGKRKSHFEKNFGAMIKGLTPFVKEDALVKTDEHKSYPIHLEKYFPKAIHKAYKGRKACVVGQGEMKRGGKDPLFEINHTCAMLRDNIARLLRRSWCLSQKAEMLQNHLDIFCYFYNQIYLAQK